MIGSGEGQAASGRAVVLAGGRGSRLRPFTFSIPKPLVPIGEMPIIEILMRQLAAQGFRRVTVSVGHLAGLIRAVCGQGEQWGVAIDYVEETEPLGTAGCLSLLDIDTPDPLLVVNGDTLTDIDFTAVVASHDPDSGITICANKRTVDIDFGVLEVDGNGRLTGYQEKPNFDFLVSMGVYVVSPWVVTDHLTPGERLDMPELIETLMTQGHAVRTYSSGSYWLDLGRIDDLERGDEVFRRERARFLPD